MKYIIYLSNDKVSRVDGRKEVIKLISNLKREDMAWINQCESKLA